MTAKKYFVDREGVHHWIGLSTDTKPESSAVPLGSRFWETDTDENYKAADSGWVKIQTSLKKLGGERSEDSETGVDHIAVAGEWAISSAIDLSNNASTTVYNGPALLGGLWVEVTIGTAAITVDDDTTTRMTVPVAIPIGVHDLKGIIFETSLVVNPADSSTGTIRVLYRPLSTAVTWAPY